LTQHFLPDSIFLQNPQMTFLIPALNEEITIGEFVDWCQEGLKNANITGQILIIDSSSDNTRKIALQHGAEVLTVEKKGLGRAYIDAIPFVRSQFILMGDADLTYDVRHIEGFIEKFNQGYEFILGSRFKGNIEKGAMPLLHRYFGTPLTTFILNKMFGCHFSDIHCGLRGVTDDALKRMQLQSQSWQYASEMVIKAMHLELKTSEVPVIFYKDRQGRLSHHKRSGWYAPWVAGWLNLKAMFTYGADFFLSKVGKLMVIFGLIGTLFLFNGPRTIGAIGFSLHWMLLFLLIFLVGSQLYFMGFLAKALYDVESKRLKHCPKFFALDYTIPLAIGSIILGILSIFPLVKNYISMGFRLLTIGSESYHAVGGLGFILFGIIYFTSALLFNAILLHPSRH